MPTAQKLLFPDPQPLVEKLGRDFFRQPRECPEAYISCATRVTRILYVGLDRGVGHRSAEKVSGLAATYSKIVDPFPHATDAGVPTRAGGMSQSVS